MGMLPKYGKRRTSGRTTAFLMAVIYLLIILSPLASLAMQSKHFIHAVTGECVGDCDICGCSPESRANRVCCCARKRNEISVTDNPVQDGHRHKPARAAKSCCPAAEPEETEDAGRAPHIHDAAYDGTAQREEHAEKRLVLKCGTPCGKGKVPAFNGTAGDELIPLTAGKGLRIPHYVHLFRDSDRRQTSRHGEPPEPPPRLAHNS